MLLEKAMAAAAVAAAEPCVLGVIASKNDIISKGQQGFKVSVSDPPEGRTRVPPLGAGRRSLEPGGMNLSNAEIQKLRKFSVSRM